MQSLEGLDPAQHPWPAACFYSAYACYWVYEGPMVAPALLLAARHLDLSTVLNPKNPWQICWYAL